MQSAKQETGYFPRCIKEGITPLAEQQRQSSFPVYGSSASRLRPLVLWYVVFGGKLVEPDMC